MRIAGAVSALTFVAMAGCGEAGIDGHPPIPCTSTKGESASTRHPSRTPYDATFAVRLDESADAVFALIADHDNMQAWIFAIDESWIEEETSDARILGSPPDLSRSWRIGEHVFTEDVVYWPLDERTLLYSLNLERSGTELAVMKQYGALSVESCLEGGSVLRWWQSFDESDPRGAASPASRLPDLSMSRILSDLARQYGGRRL